MAVISFFQFLENPNDSERQVYSHALIIICTLKKSNQINEKLLNLI